MTAAEANVERIFVAEALRSTGNVASHDHIGPRIGFVINDLAKIDA